MSASSLPIAHRSENNTSAKLRRFVSSNSTLLVAIALFLFFSLTAQPFSTPNNVFNIVRQMSVVAVLAIGMTLVILIGGIDLSVGSNLFLACGITAVLLDRGTPAVTAIALGLLASSLVGLLNGLLVEIAGISPVIATLGTLIGVRGLALVYMNNAQIRVTDAFFEWVAITRIFPIPSANITGFPLIGVIVLVLFLIFALVMRWTIYGRYVYAIGGNETAARLCGVPVKFVKVCTYVLCGFLAGIGGMLMAASTGIVSPGLGAGSEFYTIAAVMLGGASLTGGIGRVEKTLIGAFILYMVLNYMTIRRIPTEWQQAATGLLVLVVIVSNRFAGRSKPS